MDLNLRGRRALITGSSKGIGLAIARSLAAEGCNMQLVARTKAELDKAAAQISGGLRRRGGRPCRRSQRRRQRQGGRGGGRRGRHPGEQRGRGAARHAAGDRRGALAQVLGPQAVRRDQPDARNLRPDVRARARRDHQHRRHGRRAAGRLLHRRQHGERGADHVLALARRRQHPPRRARARGQSRPGRDRVAHQQHQAARQGAVRRREPLARHHGAACR